MGAVKAVGKNKVLLYYRTGIERLAVVLPECKSALLRLSTPKWPALKLCRLSVNGNLSWAAHVVGSRTSLSHANVNKQSD